MANIARLLALLGLSALAACVTQLKPAYDDARVKSLASSKLEKFESEADFHAYLRDVRKVARARGMWWASLARREYAQAKTAPQEVPCPAGVTPPCYADAPVEAVAVTGSRIAPSPAA